MVLISLKKLTVFFLSSLVLIGFLVFLPIHIFGIESINSSITSQNILFWGLIVVILQIILFYNLYHSHRKIIKNIKKITQIGELSHPKVKKIISEMGTLGLELDSLIRNQNEIIELRAERILTLNILIKTLCSGYNRAILITDINGTIFSISNLLKDKFEKEEGIDLLKNDNITNIINDLPLKVIINSIENEKKEWTDDKLKGIKCYPVLNTENMVSFCIWEFDSVNKKSLKIAEKNIKNIKPLNSFFNKIIKKNHLYK